MSRGGARTRGPDPRTGGGGVRRSDHTLRVDWPACAAHGLCAEILPEVVSLDEWGFPIVHEPVTDDLLALARGAVKACPTLALRLTQSPPGP